jgi:NAD(P)-dependent dehydrogenase (short-subunit alcohol dehydrogenase family)
MTTPRPATPADGVAWITGASQGIGAATALRLVRDGWTVVASARRADALATVATQAPAGRIVPFALDVTDLAACRAAVPAIEAAHGPVALAILNAGTYAPDAMETLKAEAVKATHDLNVMGIVNCLDPLVPAMLARGRGHLALVSSVAGYRGLPRSIAYGSSKAAVINMAESLKLDGDRLGIRVQLVNPGFVRTPLTDRNDFPMPFLMEVEDAADALVRGLAGKAFEIAFPRRFVFLLNRLRSLPDAAYFALVSRGTGRT